MILSVVRTKWEAYHEPQAISDPFGVHLPSRCAASLAKAYISLAYRGRHVDAAVLGILRRLPGCIRVLTMGLLARSEVKMGGYSPSGGRPLRGTVTCPPFNAEANDFSISLYG
jgi:hypothetical protein